MGAACLALALGAAPATRADRLGQVGGTAVESTPELTPSKPAPVPAAGKAEAKPATLTTHPIGAPGRAAGWLVAPGASAWYELRLDAGVFLAGSALQAGVDVAVVIHPPGATPPMESDSRWHGPEPVWIRADTAGVYRIEVRAVEKHSRQGDYILEFEAPRPAAMADRERLKAQALSTEAKRLLRQNAADGYPQALAKYQEALPLWEAAGDRVGVAQALNTLGHIHHRLQDLPKSEECYARSLEIRRQDGDFVGEGECCHNLAALRSAQGKADSAMELYRQALELRQRGGDELGQTQTLSNLGTVCFRSGDFQGAAGYFEQALSLARELNARPEMIQTLIGLGAIYHRIGDWQPALDCLEENATLLREMNYLPGLAFNQLNLGAVLIELGELDRSVACLRDVPELMQRIRNRSGEAAAWLNLGNAYLYKDDPARAMECYGKARAILGETNDPNVQTAALVYTGRALVEAGRFTEARQSLEQVLERVRRLGDRRWEAQALLYLGLADQGEGRDAEAEAHMEEALAVAREAAFTSGEVNALFSLGELERQTGDLDAAAGHLAEGITRVENMRAGLRTQQLRLTFFALMQEYYDAYIEVLMRLHEKGPAAGHDAEALQASEQARARLLVERLRGGGVVIEPRGATELAGQIRRLNHTIGLAGANSGASGRSPHERDPEKAQREMASLQKQYRDLQRRLRTEAPAYAALVQPEAAPLAAMQALLEPGTTLLEYKLGRERSFLWVVTPDRLTAFILPPAAEIEASARRLYERLTERNRRRDGESFVRRQQRIDAADQVVPSAAADLGRKLLPPDAIQPDVRRLVVVADGILQWIPFEVLSPLPSVGNDRGRSQIRWLADQYEVVYLPSVTALQALRQETTDRRQVNKILAVFADPVFDPTDARVSGKDALATPPPLPASARRDADLWRDLAIDGQRLPRLPFSRAEAESLIRLVPRGTARKVLDFDACRTAILDPALAEYSYIHFATHGLLDTGRPERSGLVMSLVDSRGRPQDGVLRLADIYGLRLPACQVTLSACQTALGKEIRGEGLLSLTRGFMYAGAERILASVWKVDDEATARLMEEYYRRIFASPSLPPSRAMQAARQAVRRQKRWSAPYYWAGFVLQGEWRSNP